MRNTFNYCADISFFCFLFHSLKTRKMINKLISISPFLLFFAEACIFTPPPTPPATTTTAKPTTTTTLTTTTTTTLKPVTFPDEGTNCACSDNVLNIVPLATADLCSEFSSNVHLSVIPFLLRRRVRCSLWVSVLDLPRLFCQAVFSPEQL